MESQIHLWTKIGNDKMNKKIAFRWLLLIILLPFLLLLKAEAKIADLVSEATLSNGMKVILIENHKAPLVTFQVWYRVGSRNESCGKTGLSHMMEHMM
jgi:zinc protease